MRRPSLRWCWVLASLLCLACGRNSTSPVTREIAQRWINEEPAATFDRQMISEASVVFSWPFAEPRDLEGWQVTFPEGRQRFTSGGLRLAGGSRMAMFERDVDLEASDIEVFEVDIAGLRRGHVRLFWKREGEKLAPERMLRALGNRDLGGDVTTYRLRSLDHDEWSGRIQRLRLDPNTSIDQTIRLMALRGVRYQVPPEKLRAAVKSAWKVDLDNELRDALLTPPGFPAEHTFDIPAGAQLRFAYGIEDRANCGVLFRVSAAVDAEPARTLFEARLDPSQGNAQRWNEAVVDLEELAGRRVSFRLEAVADDPDGLGAGIPVWAHPEILRPVAGARQPNVVVISVDTLRPDHLSLYGYPRETSPGIDDWARRSAVVFEKAVASAPWTLPSHVSLFSGLDADRHGINHRFPMPGEIETMAELLRGEGYRTLALTGGGWMSPRYGFAQGFDLYRYWPPETAKDDELEISIGHAMRWIEGRSSEPFFLFLHTFEVHSPHRQREPFFTRLAGSTAGVEGRGDVTEKPVSLREEGFELRKGFVWGGGPEVEKWTPLEDDEMANVTDLYDSGIAYADSLITRLLTRLQENDLAANTLVVLTSDHGEALGEKGLASHGYLYDFNLLIPMVIALPGGLHGGKRVTEQVRAIDLLPTLLEAIRAESRPAAEIDGVSLLGLIDGSAPGPPEAWSYAAASNRGLSVRVSNRVKMIFNNTAWAPLRGREEIYDLVEDRGELEASAHSSRNQNEIRRRFLERLTENATGVEMRLENRGARPFRGTLRGSAVKVYQLKALTADGPALEWAGSGRAELRVDPGVAGSFLIEGSGSEKLSLELELSNEAPFRAELDPAIDGQPLRIGRQGRQWRILAAEESDDLAWIVLHRRGNAFNAAPDPTATDPKLRAQLQALGYLDD